MALVNVAIFAYNEERTIGRALDSVFCAAPTGEDVCVFVLANGCTDATVDFVRGYAARQPEVNPVEIPLGDKCNAWNLYVHELADDKAEAHFFMDGDCWCSPKSLERMLDVLRENPQATSVAGTPQSGRNRRLYIDHQKKRGWIFGNLYGIRKQRIREIRQRELKLPVGLKGNDHFITRMVLAPLPNLRDRVAELSVYDENAGYLFDKLQPYRRRDLNIYFNRMVTYELRQRQIPYLQPLALDELPDTVDEINQKILADLRSQGALWHPVQRAVRKRLERMYPAADTAFYREKCRTAGRPVILSGSQLQPVGS